MLEPQLNLYDVKKPFLSLEESIKQSLFLLLNLEEGGFHFQPEVGFDKDQLIFKEFSAETALILTNTFGNTINKHFNSTQNILKIIECLVIPDYAQLKYLLVLNLKLIQSDRNIELSGFLA